MWMMALGCSKRDLQKVNVLFETSRVDCKGKFLEEIKDFHTDVILSDHFLPPFNSINALKICRKKRMTFSVPKSFPLHALRKVLKYA